MRIKEIPLRAPRGRIYDRYHRILADNRPSYDIILIREKSPHTVEQTVDMLSMGVNMSKEELLDRINRKRREPKFRPIILKEDVSVGDIAYVKAHELRIARDQHRTSAQKAVSPGANGSARDGLCR